MGDSRERRALVPTRQNENTSLDFVVSVEFSMPLPITGGEGRLYVRYVPDRLLLDMEDLAPWLTHIEAIEAQEIEQAAVMVMNDLNSELVPRWIQVLVRTHGGGEVLVEDRQPDWDNPSLLAVLKPL